MKNILKFFKNNFKKILIVIIILTILLLVILRVKNVVLDIREKNINDKTWLSENINIKQDDSFGSNINVIDTKDYVDIFKINYQVVVEDKINELINNNNYTLDDMLVIYNPYGTNNLSANVYFNTNTSMKISYTVSVNNDDIPNYSNTLNNDNENNYGTIHAYQIIGLVPGYKNTISFVAIDNNSNEIKKEIVIDMSGVSCKSDVILDVENGDSTYELTDGLYTLFGLDKAFNANNYLYDNNGILRADLVLEDYRSDRIIFYDDKMIYSYNTNKFSVINRLGKIEKTYKIDGYTMHHDYVLDEENNKLLILVNSNKEDDKTIEDLIISLDLKTGKISEIVDMKDLMPEIYETAKMPESGLNTYGGTGLDWIHLNSLSLVNSSGDIVLSSRETSTIIYLSDIYNNPTIKYLIADDKVYEDTKYQSLVLNKVGDFVNQAGQHTITYVKDDSLSDGQYYLEMYNNNYGASNTREDFPWEEYPGVGTYKEGTYSKYYKYLIDENKKTYELVESFDVDYSSIVSSIQDKESNHITSSGMSNSYAEYDVNGKLIKQFNYTSKKYAYRVFKYSFNNFWFD